MKAVSSFVTFALLACCVNGKAKAQSQDELSWPMRSDLRSFVTSADSLYYHNVSILAQMYLSSAARDAKTEEDFKALFIASRILYCQKVLEDLNYSTPNYSGVKSNFESELKNDLTSLKNAIE
jgi:hypothetical protein